ncbi:MAG: sulfatase-like hydrolase/transferase, partial [Ahrensia sp.]
MNTSLQSALASKFIAFTLRPVTVALLALAFAGGLYAVEGRWQHMPYIVLIVVFLSSAAFILSKRFAFSAYLSMTVVGLITLISIAKFKGQGFDLHVYDIAFTGSDTEALKFLLATYWNLALPVVAVMVVAVVGLVMVWRGERPSKICFRFRAIALALSAALIPVSYPLDAANPRYFHYLAGFNASAFFVSFVDIAEAFADDPIKMRVESAVETSTFETSNSCDGFEVKPDIYIVLSESATNYKIYPEVNLQNIPENAFISEDQNWRFLRVETFGGGTWVSNLSLMTGLASRDFGWRAPYLTVQLEDQIQESLATLLKRCGYHTAVMTPMKHSFVNEGPFLESIGFDTILDFDAIQATAFNHRDDYYYQAADTFLQKHIQSDGRPIFMQIQTMFAHSPFDDPREPQIKIQEAAFVQNGPLNEHIRRVYIAQNDFHTFIERRKELQPDRPFVVLEFGDHQTLAARTLADEQHGGNSLADPDSSA